MIRGEEVDIYVGKEKKHYRVPRDLLCSQSKYFNACFNGNFKEGQTQKLEILEDRVEFFELLLEYMYHGNITPGISSDKNWEVVQTKQDASWGLEWDVDLTVRKCIDFIAYANFYDLGPAGMAVYETLKKSFENRAQLKVDHIETIFHLTPPNPKLRSLITSVALCQQGPTGQGLKHLESELEGFAQEMLYQIRAGLTDPLINLRQWPYPFPKPRTEQAQTSGWGTQVSLVWD